MTKKQFSKITEIAVPQREEGADRRTIARDEGEAILRNWTEVARWFFADEEVADLLEKQAARLRA